MDSNNKLIILSVGRDIAESAEKILNKKANKIFQKPEIEPSEYPELRKNIYQYIKENQTHSIDIILSGPVSFVLTLGQIIGLNHFDITVYHFDSKERAYVKIEPPTRYEIV